MPNRQEILKAKAPSYLERQDLSDGKETLSKYFIIYLLLCAVFYCAFVHLETLLLNYISFAKNGSIEILITDVLYLHTSYVFFL